VIVDANDAFLGMIGWSRSDVANRRLELAEVLFDRNNSHDATVPPLLVVDRQLLTRDGERVPVLFGVTPIPEFQGRGLGFVLDVTEQRRRAELEELLIGIVSHDLRNPLSVVTMGASMLLSQELTEPQRKLATRIANASQKSARLISDLLDFTIAKRAGIQLTLAPCDLHDVVAQAVSDLETTWPGRAIVHERFGEAVACLDHSRVEQILLNLIGNALQHSPPATAVMVESRGEADTVVFSVTNRGKPIPNDVMLQLFTPLRRGEHAGYQRGSIGLGLFIVQHLVTAHGGTIDVSSNQLAGTCFTVRLPRTLTAGARAE
jgi:signal transduction histidine kinase